MHITTTTVGRHFVESLAHHPVAGNAKNKMLHHDREAAQGMAYVSPDLPYLIQWMKIDIDDPTKNGGKKRRGEAHTCTRWIDADLPQPHFIVTTKDNTGSHYLYGLALPVHRGNGSRPQPRALFASIVTGYTRALMADGGYIGTTIKNPMNSRWQTITADLPLYSLHTLQNALPPIAQRLLRKGEALSEGRNCDLFDHARFWAYNEVHAAHRAGSYEAWLKAVSSECRANNVYAVPLPRREVASVAQSVASYCWRNISTISQDGRKTTGPRKRSEVLSYNRQPMSPEEAREAMSEGGRAGGQIGAPITHAIRRNKTYDAITGALGTLAGQGVHSPTVGQIATAAGVSERTVQNFRASQRNTTGN